MANAAERSESTADSSSFSITTRRPVAILMVVVAVCVFGWVSYQQLALDLMPDIAYPTLTVRTEYPGTAPEEVETLVSRPLEQELGVASHLVSISSVSKAGQSDVVLEFEWDTDMNDVSQDIREKVDRVWLPQEAERPLLLRYDPSLDPIMRIGLHGPQSLYELRYLAEHDIKRELEAVTGVAAVKIKGGLEEEIHVALNESQMAIMGLDIGQINSRLAQANVNLPGGNLREGQTEYLIRTLNEFRTVDEIAALIIARQGGAEIRLSDIAQVYTSHKDREIVTRVNGRESVEIEIYKEADANVVAVAEQVRNRLYGLPVQQEYVAKLQQEEEEAAVQIDGDADNGDLSAQKREEAMRISEHLKMVDFLAYRLPEGALLDELSDQSVFIVNSIDQVQQSALIGGLMAILILFIFLRNVSHTVIIGLTIPVSIVATFAPMHLFDVSLNIMSLGGLALGIGMLVDNSIVVLESIFRCREEGDDLITATVRGTGEVGGAVFASTLTTIAVFFPIVFIEGVAGQVFGDMALTVVFSLLASLGVALYFIPMLASRQIGGQGGFTEQMRQSDFLRLKSWRQARELVAGKEVGWGARIQRGSLIVPLLLVDLGWRLALVVAVLVMALLKSIGLLLYGLLWWLIKPIEYFLVKPERTTYAWVVAQEGSSRVGRWRFFELLWPNILAFAAVASLGQSAGACWAWARRPRLLWQIVRLPLVPPVLLYLLLRFLLQVVLRLVGILLHAVLMLVGLALVTTLFLAALILLPVFAPLLFLFERAFGLAQAFYPSLLRWALKRRLGVVGVALIGFGLCWFKLVPQLGSELIPQVHQGEFNLDLTMPVGTPLEKTAQVIGTIEKRVIEQAEVERVATTVGTDGSASSAVEEGEHTGQVTVRLKAGSNAVTEEALINRLRVGLRDLPEAKTEVSHPALFSFKTPIEVEIRGYDLGVLRRLSREAQARLTQVPGLVDVKSSLLSGNPELQIVYNRDRLAEYGLGLRQVAELVRNKVQGWVPTDFRQEEQQIDILVRLRQEDRVGLEELRRLVVNPGGAVPIPLSAVAWIRIEEGPSEIRRIDQARAALLTANIQGVDLGTVSRSIEKVMQELDYPSGFTFLISGQNREMETSLNSLFLALGLAIFLVYIVMASQFESLIHPFVIMFTVPLALVGVVVVLYLGQIPVSIVVFIGLIMLAGIVVNNAIVLVSYINGLRRKGLEKAEAIIEGGAARLRPILMTTLTTVLGLLPMALGLGEGAEIRTPMAITVIAGLTSSTFLTLIVIPTVYSLLDWKE